MYLEHFQLNHSPFMEEPDANVFYGGGGRDTVYQALLADVLSAKPLIKLTGREGSGKTLLCRLLVENLPESHDVVYIDNPIGSFDDLLRIVCLDLGMQPTNGEEPVQFTEELDTLLQQRKDAGSHVLIVIDEAEKLFLATLERLVRTICTGEEGDGLSIVLSGRPGLDANLEQLSVFCANVDINAGYTLLPLTETETVEYMMFRLERAGLTRDRHDEIFTEGASSKIYAAAQGNVRMINILAEESLQNSFSDKSFMVLLDHVGGEEDTEHLAETKSERTKEKILWLREAIEENKLLAGAVAAALLLIIVIGVLLVSGDDPEVATEKAPKIIIGSSQPEQEVAEAKESPDAQTPPAIASPPLAEPEPEQQAVVAPPSDQSQEMESSEVASEQTDFVEKLVTEPTAKEVAPEEELSVDEEGESLADVSEPDPENEVIVESLDTPADDAHRIEPIMPVHEDNKIITVRPLGKKRPYGQEPQNLVEVAPLKEKKIAAAPPEVEPAPPAIEESNNKGRNGKQLFRERRRASATWLAEAYRGAYTIQLMMLTSNQAESNLVKMLVQDQYFDIKNKLYILRKKTNPPTLFVYYGIYDSMDQARDARNSMPVFLRKHHPYALGINDALKKSED